MEGVPQFDPNKVYVEIEHPLIGTYWKQGRWLYHPGGEPLNYGKLVKEARAIREASFLAARDEVLTIARGDTPDPDNLPTSHLTVNNDGNFDNVPPEAVRWDYLKEWAESQGYPYPGRSVVGQMAAETARARGKGREPDMPVRPVTPGGGRP